MTRTAPPNLFFLIAAVLMAAFACVAGAQTGPGIPGHAVQADPSLARDLGVEGDNASRPLVTPAGKVSALLIPEEDFESPTGGTARTMLALGAVLGLIFALSWVFKFVARKSGGLAGAMGAGGRAPAGLVEVLARYPVASRQTLVVLRFDRRVLLCSMASGGRASAGGMSVLCELDDPEDVASVLMKSRDEAGESIARSFERALDEADLSVDRAAAEPIRVRVPEQEADRAIVTRTGGLGGPGNAEDRNALVRGLEAIWRGGNR